jgi:hypothetical protein
MSCLSGIDVQLTEEKSEGYHDWTFCEVPVLSSIRQGSRFQGCRSMAINAFSD